MDFTPLFGTLRPFLAWTLRPLTLRPFWPQNRVKIKNRPRRFCATSGSTFDMGVRLLVCRRDGWRVSFI